MTDDAEIVRLQKELAVAKVRLNQIVQEAALYYPDHPEMADFRRDAVQREMARLRELLKPLLAKEKRSECDAPTGGVETKTEHTVKEDGCKEDGCKDHTKATTQLKESELAKQHAQAKAAMDAAAMDGVLAEITQLRQENAQLAQKLKESEAAKQVAAANAVAAALCAAQAFRVVIKRSHGRPEMVCYYKTVAGAEAFKTKVVQADALLHSKSEDPFVAKVEITKIPLYADDEDPNWK